MPSSMLKPRVSDFTLTVENNIDKVPSVETCMNEQSCMRASNRPLRCSVGSSSMTSQGQCAPAPPDQGSTKRRRWQSSASVFPLRTEHLQHAGSGTNVRLPQKVDSGLDTGGCSACATMHRLAHDWMYACAVQKHHTVVNRVRHKAMVRARARGIGGKAP